MYKVFIDHKPVVFISEGDLSTKSPHIQFVGSISVKKDIRPSLTEEITLDHPLFIACEDPKKAFKKTFKNYLKIEAAGGLVNRKGKYLLIKRKGLWDIPKGRIDKGEEKEIACVREIMEECGISGHTITEPLTTTYHLMKYKGRKAIKKTYWYLLDYNGPKATRPERKEGITKAKWMPIEYMMSIRGHTYGSINDVLDAFDKNVLMKQHLKKQKLKKH